jgi:hypothetical protein
MNAATTTERAWGPARREVPAGAWRISVVLTREGDTAKRSLFSAGQVLVGFEYLRLQALLPTLTVVLHRLLEPLAGQLRAAVDADTVVPVERYEIETTLTVGATESRRWHRFALHGPPMPAEVDRLVERIALLCVQDGTF